MKSCLATLALVLFGCAPELPPATESDVVRFLVADFVLPMRDVLVASRASDCGTDGETGSAVPAALFAAFLAANNEDFAPLDLAAYAPRLRVDSSAAAPRAISRRQREPVLALARIGIDGNEALACVEVFGVDERGFFLLLQRDPGGRWSVQAELEAWRIDASASAAEELPDGTRYEAYQQ